MKKISFKNFSQIFLKYLLNISRGYSYNFKKNGEMSLLRKIKKLSPQIVFDVGACTGDYSKMALSLLPNSKIFAFEINKENYKNLCKEILSDRLVANNFGLHSSKGQLDFKDYGFGHGGTTTVIKNTFHDEINSFNLNKCLVTTGDIFCEENYIDRIDFLKIDVEGAEFEVLLGFRKMLSKQKVRLIQFEYGYANGDDGRLMRDFYNLLNSYGYIVARLNNGSINFRNFRYEDNNFDSGPNFIAIHADDGSMLSKF